MAKGKRKHIKIGRETAKTQVSPTEKYRAFTIKFGGTSDRIVTPINLSFGFGPDEYQDGELPPLTPVNALWDTGATKSVLTSATVKKLGLTPVGVTTINHAGGTSQSNTYLVNFYLPNRVIIPGVLVSECEDIAGNFGAIVGMDIIASGDLSITNMGGKTCMSFRIPSIALIDYVEEHNHLMGNRKSV
jgi:hypothetical protein